MFQVNSDFQYAQCAVWGGLYVTKGIISFLALQMNNYKQIDDLTHPNVLITWFILRSIILIESSLEHPNNEYPSGDISNEVTLPCNNISLELESERVSQKRIFLSKWPLIILVPSPSDVTRSLQLEPANIVLTPEIIISLLIKVNFKHVLHPTTHMVVFISDAI